MLNTDEDAVICDLAETYGILDYKGLSLKQVATFCCGLRPDSRIMLELNDITVPTGILLQAMMVDNLNFISWSKTESAQNGENKPKSIANILLGKEETQTQNNCVYASGEEFEQARQEILRRI